MICASPLLRRGALLAACAVPLLIAGCKTRGDVVVEGGIGITAVRTACPAVGIPDYTGDVTLFTSPDARDSGSIDVTATMTDVRNACDQASATVHNNVSFVIEARRSDARGARDITLPFFVTVIRGGTAVIAKRIGSVTVHFADGETRAQAGGRGGAEIDKAEATLNARIRNRITQKRKAGQADAAVDPLAEPEVQAAVQRASFEVLVGFQLNDKQLAYNVTR